MVSDTVGDFIIRLKNAGAIGKHTVVVPHSKLRFAIAKKLAEAGYIADVEERRKKTPQLLITLKYEDGAHRINGVKRMSKPGRRLYTKVDDIHPIKFGRGHLILSTPAGILTNDEAKAQRVGGEQLFTIW